MANERLYEDMEPREKFDALWLKAGLHKRPGADALLYDLEQQGFFDLPASIKHHSTRFGGLATHTVNVADAAMELCETNHAFKDCDKNFGGDWDAICGYGSYGFKQGLLEVMGNIRDDNGVEGWLTAEQVVEMARKAGQQT